MPHYDLFLQVFVVPNMSILRSNHVHKKSIPSFLASSSKGRLMTCSLSSPFPSQKDLKLGIDVSSLFCSIVLLDKVTTYPSPFFKCLWTTPFINFFDLVLIFCLVVPWLTTLIFSLLVVAKNSTFFSLFFYPSIEHVWHLNEFH